MRALMLLAIALAGTCAAPVFAASPGDSTTSAESGTSPATAENAAARSQSTPAGQTDSPTTSAADTAAATQSSASTDAPAKDPAAAARPPAPRPATDAAKEEEAFKIPPSYKPRLRDGETVYCRRAGESGTRFKKTECYTFAELKYKVESEKAAADDLTRRARVCSNAAVCAGN